MPGRRTGPSPGKLPIQLSTFVGRQDDIVSTMHLLQRARLVVLIGPGGIGKSSLALQLASRVGEANGSVLVRWVMLSALPAGAEAVMLEQTIAEAFGVIDFSTVSPWSGLLNQVASQNSLLVLDGCEHLAGLIGELVDDLLSAAPRLRVLATSQVSLGVQGERLVPVGPLPYPRLGDASATRYPSTDLLYTRAAELGVVLADIHRPAALQLCRRLEGIPLAIVLAAGRLRHLSLEAITAGLSGQPDQRLELLIGGPQYGAHPLHHSLRTALDWSLALCEDAQRLLLARCSIFADSWDQIDAQQVCTGGGITAAEIPLLLERLVDLQLVQADTSGLMTRFCLLESLRVYGWELVEQQGETTSLRRRHRDHFRELVARAAREWFSDQELVWLERIRQALPDLRKSVDWSLTTPGEAAAGLEIAVNLVRVRSPYLIGSPREGREMIERGLAALESPHGHATDPEQATAITTGRALAGWIALCQGDQTAAQHYNDQINPTPTSQPSPAAMFLRGTCRFLIDQDHSAIELLSAARQAFATDNTQWRGDAAMAELMEAMAAAFLADPNEALETSTRWVNSCTIAGAPWATSWAVLTHGIALTHHGHPACALETQRKALAAQRAIPDRWGTVWAPLTIAWALAKQLAANTHTGTDTEAATTIALLLGGAESLRNATGVSLEGLAPFATHTANTCAIAQNVLHQPTFDTLYERGLRMRREDVLDLAMGRTPPISEEAQQWATLTRTEAEIALLAAEGLSNKQIATQRRCSVRTIESHVHNVLYKLQIDSRTGILPWLLNANLPLH